MIKKYVFFIVVTYNSKAVIHSSRIVPYCGIVEIFSRKVVIYMDKMETCSKVGFYSCKVIFYSVK
jgi:hypothetical protein